MKLNKREIRESSRLKKVRSGGIFSMEISTTETHKVLYLCYIVLTKHDTSQSILILESPEISREKQLFVFLSFVKKCSAKLCKIL